MADPLPVDGLSQPHHKESITASISTTEEQNKPKISSASPSPQRAESWPSEYTSIRVEIVTTLEGNKKRSEHDIQVDQSAQDNYQHIETTAKSVFEEHVTCPAGKEVSLFSGLCQLSCSDTCEPCKACDRDTSGGRYQKPEYQLERLEQWEDWADIRTLIKNLLHTHKDLKVTIMRNLDMTSIPVTPHDPRSLDSTPRDWLFTKLYDARQRLPNNLNLTYISNESIQKLTSREIVFAVIQNANEIPKERRDDFQRRAYNAPILFAIFVRHRLSLSLLEEALNNGISDRSLPLSYGDPLWLQDRKRRNDLIIWHEELVKQQWEFLAATFDKYDNDEHQKFSPEKIIPYRLREKCGAGAFSRVYKIELEASHQKIYTLPNVNWPFLAFKIIAKILRRIRIPNLL
jgi:hypothetical protein